MDKNIHRIVGSEDNPFIMSIGDIMAALLLIFILLLSATLLQLKHEYIIKTQQAENAKQSAEIAQKSADEIRQIAETFKKLKIDIYNDLYEEFKNDLDRWKATIDKETLSVRFKEPEVLFARGEENINDKFKIILNEFFPRYIALLWATKYRNYIEEIRIEGHTSSEWYNEQNTEPVYFKNMKLSQDRTRSVLEYSLNLITGDLKDWAQMKITANGLSFSKLIMNHLGEEDKEASRRVEFRVRTNAEDQIGIILQKTSMKGFLNESSPR